MANVPREITVSDRLRYRFDNTMSRGTVALIGWLALATLTLIVVLTGVMLLLGIGPKQADSDSQRNFFDTLWYGLMRTMDAGALGGDDGSWWFLLGGLGITIGGIFIFSTLIGVLSSGIEGKLEELRKGRSFVVERNHTLILGWSPQVFSIVSELAIANANQKHACVVILAEMDKVEMEDEMRAKAGALGRMRVVCRSGSPMDLTDLEIVNPHHARSIVVLAPPVDDPDSHVIKTVLALTNNPARRAEPYHIVAEIRDPRNVEVAKMVGRDEVQLIQAGDLIARIAVQTSRQSGLSVVYTELLDFSGDEIYFHSEPGLTGRTFGDALLAYEDSAPIGLRFADGRVQLSPPMETVLAAGDRIIAIAEDDDTLKLTATPGQVDEAAIQTRTTIEAAPERTLILGFNRRTTTIITELDQYVALGSGVVVVADLGDAEAAISAVCASLANLRVCVQHGDTTDRRTLESLDVDSYEHIIVLSYSDDLGPQEADARTLITLLHLRDMSERGGYDYSIVSEMLDIRNRELAEVTRADDFIVSDKLASLLFAQISENRELAAVFDDLFDADGVELYLKPADGYVRPGTPVSFYTIVESARRRGEVAIGYRLKSGAGDAARSYGVVVNPAKSQSVTFDSEERVIVLAEA
jgi:ion channel POLLUX/CASTOR